MLNGGNRLSLTSPIELILWDEQAVLFHIDSGLTILIDEPLYIILKFLQSQPSTLQNLFVKLFDSDSEELEAQPVIDGLISLINEGIISVQ